MFAQDLLVNVPFWSNTEAFHADFNWVVAALTWRLLFLTNASRWLNWRQQWKMQSQQGSSRRRSYRRSPSLNTCSSQSGQPVVTRNVGTILLLNIHEAEVIDPATDSWFLQCSWNTAAGNAPYWFQKPIPDWILPCRTPTKCHSRHCHLRVRVGQPLPLRNVIEPFPHTSVTQKSVYALLEWPLPKPGLWSRKSRHPTPTPGNFDSPTFSCISYLKW